MNRADFYIHKSTTTLPQRYKILQYKKWRWQCTSLLMYKGRWHERQFIQLMSWNSVFQRNHQPNTHHMKKKYDTQPTTHHMKKIWYIQPPITGTIYDTQPITHHRTTIWHTVTIDLSHWYSERVESTCEFIKIASPLNLVICSMQELFT